MDDAEQLVRRLYAEAAATCGDDVMAIDRYVADRVAALSEEDRLRFNRVTEKVLGFQAPAQRPYRSH